MVRQRLCMELQISKNWKIKTRANWFMRRCKRKSRVTKKINAVIINSISHGNNLLRILPSTICNDTFNIQKISFNKLPIHYFCCRHKNINCTKLANRLKASVRLKSCNLNGTYYIFRIKLLQIFIWSVIYWLNRGKLLNQHLLYY